MCSPDPSTANDDVLTIALDSQGNIILAGSFVYIDFDPGAGTQLMTADASGTADAFILKLDKDGNFIWVKTMPGAGFKRVNKIVIDESDNIYTLGRFDGTIDLNTDTSVADIRSSAGLFDTFIAKYTSNGSYVWGLNYGGTGGDFPENIVLNGNNVYACGSFSGTVDLDPTSGTNSVTALGGQDGYVSSFTKDGAYNSSFVIPGSTNGLLDTIQGVYFDSSGNMYLSGSYGSLTVGGNTYPPASTTNLDNFYLKLTPSMAFSSIYLVQGLQNQTWGLMTGYGTNKFLIAGACVGAAAFDYTHPTTTTSYSNAAAYTYLSKIDFDATLATDAALSKTKISVYPNPVKNNVFINSDTKVNLVRIFNMEGRNVYSTQGNNITSLNLSILPKGVYTLQSTDEKGKVAQTKLIKE